MKHYPLIGYRKNLAILTGNPPVGDSGFSNVLYLWGTRLYRWIETGTPRWSEIDYARLSGFSVTAANTGNVLGNVVFNETNNTVAFTRKFAVDKVAAAPVATQGNFVTGLSLHSDNETVSWTRGWALSAIGTAPTGNAITDFSVATDNFTINKTRGWFYNAISVEAGAGYISNVSVNGNNTLVFAKTALPTPPTIPNLSLVKNPVTPAANAFIKDMSVNGHEITAIYQAVDLSGFLASNAVEEWAKTANPTTVVPTNKLTAAVAPPNNPSSSQNGTVGVLAIPFKLYTTGTESQRENSARVASIADTEGKFIHIYQTDS